MDTSTQEKRMALTALKGLSRTKKKKRAGNRRSADKSLEPTWENWQELTGEQYHRKKVASSEWYYQTYKASDLYPYAFEWMALNGYSKEDIKAAKAADSWAISQVAAIHCRMMTRGMPDFNQKEDDYWQTLPGTMGHIRPSSEFIKKRLQEAIEKGKLVVTEKKEEAKEKAQYYQPTIQERLRKASINMAADMDDIIEQPVDEINIKEFSPLKMLRQKQAKANHGKIIKEFYNDEMMELEEVLNPIPQSVKSRWTEQERDWHDQLQESYAIFTKDQIKKKHQVLKLVVDACDMIIAEGKLTRKPRKVKPKSAEKLVAKLKYKKADEKTALVSINPADIIKAEELWVYNAKTRKLGRYITSTIDPLKQKRDGTGLEVKGTTIIRFDEKTSIAKTLRKPVEQLAEFKKCGKIQRKKFFESIKTTETKLNGRVNLDTILLLTT